MVAFILTIVGQQQISHITYREIKLIMAFIILGLMAQKYGIQLEEDITQTSLKTFKEKVKRKFIGNLFSKRKINEFMGHVTR